MKTQENIWIPFIKNCQHQLKGQESLQCFGRVTRVAGLVMEATGLKLAIGSPCHIRLPSGHRLDAEVVGFGNERLFLMPLGDVEGVQPGALVIPSNVEKQQPTLLHREHKTDDSLTHGRRVPVGDALLGRVLDATGQPIDALGPIYGYQTAPLYSQPINPLRREPITTVLDVGIRAINSMLSVGRGQRMGLFAGSGVGKSVLLGMMARYTSADVIVVGLIGERGREVKEFIENILGDEGLARSVVVAAPADLPPLLRLQGATYATVIAEHFRDEGKNVLLIMDSLTRFAMAQREIALAIGEPPATKGYPPSVFAKLPALVERAGNGEAGGGSITAFYTVLTEGDDQQDPIADAARAILDGHIVLSRTLADSGHYPAIDIEQSISRAMHSITDADHQTTARDLKQLLSVYQRNLDLINVGAYNSGSNPLLDKAISMHERITKFLQQGIDECVDVDQSVNDLHILFT
ncbi:MAG: flagellar protein export ATPase FliI [Methylococcaceae bacterium]|jgi:flagellum-specific ATP synthase